MKVLLLNGSPHANGTTYATLTVIQAQLRASGIDSEVFQIGGKPIAGCIGCGACRKSGKCAFGEDGVNAFIEKAKGFDGYVFASPVHFASASGAVTAFLDRGFCAANANFAYKPAATVAVARRAGTTATLDQLNKYPLYASMYLVGSRYWNMVHGAVPADITKDEEGLLVMRALADNLAYLLKALEAAKIGGVPRPLLEPAVRTNFIK
ncbi:MAG: flavodoxin family protein [Christensenellaceae bacterium]|jgi:multimeric flavodoxin WrbA|nr:flavodoxin family protein [Christensenellaceae bacterium]